MSTDYAGNPASFPANVRLVDDGEPAAAAFLGLCSQDLADRTAYLKSHVDTIEATIVAPPGTHATAISYVVGAGVAIVSVTSPGPRAGPINITLPSGAPVGSAVLIVEVGNDATAINMVPPGGETFFTTRTAITFGKDACLAKKIDAATWVLYFVSDFDIHVLNAQVNGPWRVLTGGGPYTLTLADRVVVMPTGGERCLLPNAPPAGFSVKVIGSISGTVTAHDAADAVITNNGVNVSTTSIERASEYVWNGSNWILCERT